MTAVTPNTDTARTFDEFSPRKLILQIQRAFAYIFSKWKIILLVALLCGIALAIYSYFKKPYYVAEVTFTLDEEATQGAKSGFSALGEELGLTSPEAGGVFSSTTNIVELMRSRLVIEKTLRTVDTINGKPLVFADFFLDSLDYREKWMKKSPYYHLNFLSAKKDEKEIRFENDIIRNIYETLVAKNIQIEKKGKETSIISVICVSKHELFSKYFLEALLAEVARYYVETKTERARLNLALVQKRTDSVRNAYNAVLYGRAAFTDAHSDPIRLLPLVSREKQQTDIQILRNAYIELTRSLELAKTNLMKETPLIQYLDMPILPLKTMRASMPKYFLIGFFLSGFLTAAYLLVRRIYRHIMLEPES